MLLIVFVLSEARIGTTFILRAKFALIFGIKCANKLEPQKIERVFSNSVMEVPPSMIELIKTVLKLISVKDNGTVFSI